MEFLLVVFVLAIVFVLLSLLMNGFAKVTNTTFKASGTGVPLASPEGWDGMMLMFKDSANALKNMSKKTASKFKQIKTDSSLSKTEKLSQLSGLKEKGDIDQQEFELLKREILGE